MVCSHLSPNRHSISKFVDIFAMKHLSRKCQLTSRAQHGLHESRYFPRPINARYKLALLQAEFCPKSDLALEREGLEDELRGQGHAVGRHLPQVVAGHRLAVLRHQHRRRVMRICISADAAHECPIGFEVHHSFSAGGPARGERLHVAERQLRGGQRGGLGLPGGAGARVGQVRGRAVLLAQPHQEFRVELLVPSIMDPAIKVSLKIISSHYQSIRIFCNCGSISVMNMSWNHLGSQPEHMIYSKGWSYRFIELKPNSIVSIWLCDSLEFHG
mmetsp:Transcript_23211/g.39799  ORF Transcript_23211/g.39799 Transcript_23211/m.39799 type:complete len:272 (-) Transcript_23211:274-1089(-)